LGSFFCALCYSFSIGNFRKICFCNNLRSSIKMNFSNLIFKLSIMTKIQQLLSAYGESHTNSTNKAIHWICVPTIFFSIVGFFYGIELPYQIAGIQLNLAMVMMLVLVVYYFLLSKTLWIGMLFFGILCLWICYYFQTNGWIPLLNFCLILFAISWVAQFYGHKIEGKKPSFLKDIQFLLIGPAWLMSFIYKKIGIPL